ncbi:hypothetical protein ACFFX0_17075 [Citricoccus parietis]|uniref:Uncharacterized protein n=1 Tax=Citricoccus parietis TaxID=592307 RepID=A0ABV5G1K6_9MICC
MTLGRSAARWPGSRPGLGLCRPMAGEATAAVGASPVSSDTSPVSSELPRSEASRDGPSRPSSDGVPTTGDAGVAAAFRSAAEDVAVTSSWAPVQSASLTVSGKGVSSVRSTAERYGPFPSGAPSSCPWGFLAAMAPAAPAPAAPAAALPSTASLAASSEPSRWLRRSEMPRRNLGRRVSVSGPA